MGYSGFGDCNALRLEEVGGGAGVYDDDEFGFGLGFT